MAIRSWPAAVSSELAVCGVAAVVLAVVWRADPSDTAIHRDCPGFQNITRLRVSG